MELSPSVRERLRRHPARPPGATGSPPPGKAPRTRFALVVGGHLLAGVVVGAILFADIEMDPALRGGMIGVIVRDALAMLTKVYEYFLPQND